MKMAIMWNARLLLCPIYIPEWTERYSIHSVSRSRMNKMAEGEISTPDTNAPLPDLPEKKKSGYTFGYNETLLLIFCTKRTRCFSVIFLSRERQFRKWLQRTWKKKKKLLSIGHKLREQVEVPNFFVPEVRRQQQQEWPPYLLRTVYSYQDRASRWAFFMHAIRIIPGILYQPFLSQNCE